MCVCVYTCVCICVCDCASARRHNRCLSKSKLSVEKRERERDTIPTRLRWAPEKLEMPGTDTVNFAEERCCVKTVRLVQHSTCFVPHRSPLMTRVSTETPSAGNMNGFSPNSSAPSRTTSRLAAPVGFRQKSAGIHLKLRDIYVVGSVRGSSRAFCWLSAYSGLMLTLSLRNIWGRTLNTTINFTMHAGVAGRDDV